MSGHATRSGEGGQAVLERIQMSVLPIAGKHTSSTLPTTSTPSMERQDVNITSKQKKCIGKEISNTQRVWTSLVSGAIAGALAKTTIAPLDRTKINFQISKQPYSARAAIGFLTTAMRTEGLLSLWRGNSATMVRIVPYSAVQFTAHEQWKRILNINGMEREKPWASFLAGALAGVTSQTMTYPLDLMRARMAVTLKAEYKTLRQAFWRMYKEEGILASYRGFTATILGAIPYAGCSFFIYDLLRNLLSATRDKPDGVFRSAACFMFDDGYVSMNSVHGDYSGILDLAHLWRHRWNGQSDKQLSTGYCAAENADVSDQGPALSHGHVDYPENLYGRRNNGFL
ncbi:PREDICTED: mitochondrial coenzyme A transporter SLC25A42 isoform X2 [Acromyrmex echinatior]|uniref:mitochondrial coenzyme A transporter SLC25A42 isoform X2 n=1 Tax=Acromyrmex echinatior TaxID=103372 RepID=UPI000580BC48|nr:PREDICTED: mitochondrial coenzyme A transporter SLC25A42 isoform X2 [Acromyrmex echinatior]